MTSTHDVVIAITGGFAGVYTAGQNISMVSASGQAITGVVSAAAPIGGAIATNPAAILLTVTNVSLNGLSIGDGLSLIGNGLSIAGAVAAVIPPATPVAIGLMGLGRALAYIGLGVTALEALGNVFPNSTGNDPISPDGDPFTGMPWPGLIGGIQKAIGNAQAQGRDPLILDLDGDGVETTALSKSMTSGVHFNLDGTGFAENTGSVGQDDGLLVRDLNDDGKISDGSELFGDYTLLKNGNRAANGFEALKDLDDNSDGVVDSQDSAFTTLKVWKDLNSNGINEDGELIMLEHG
jgi:hypothetical protein